MKLHCYFFIFITVLTFFSNVYPQIASLEATLKFESVNGIMIPFQNGIPVPSFEKQDRQIIDLKGIWKKERFNADPDISLAKRDESGMAALNNEAQDRFEVSYNDDNWFEKNIPSVENEMYTYPNVPEYYESGVWYRRNFYLPDSLSNKFIKLMFYSVNYVCDVWINGTYIGYHEGGYTPFAFDVSSILNYDGENVIAVRVDNPAWGTRNDIVPYVEADWFNYTGIIQDVYLEVSNPVNVVRADIVPLDINGSFQSTVTLINKNSTSKNVNASIEVFEADINDININTERVSELIGNKVMLSGEFNTSIDINENGVNVWRTELSIENPKLWSPKEPNLYVMKVTLTENNEVIDEFFTQFGIRTIEADGNKALLNGNPVFLTGTARHEDHPVYGRSIPLNIIFDDLKKIKELNVNLLRTAHYPNHPYTYLLADRLGITVMEEIPVWWFDDSTPWTIQNSLRRIHQQMFREMVFKDFNRPSIILWGTCNECADVTNRRTFIQRMQDDASLNYPDGRLITQSAAADRPGPSDFSQNVCDVAGWTMYFGIFHGGEYYSGTYDFLTDANTTFPEKPILDTEFGYWSSENNSTTQMQTDVFHNTFSAFEEFAPIKEDGSYNPDGFLMGITWWCAFDWYSAQHPNGFQSMGLYNMQRTTKKPVAETLKQSYAPYFNSGGTIITGLSDKPENVQPSFKLEQNFPNPFNPVTKIRFSIPAVETGHASSLQRATLKIYDILGNEIATIVNKNMSPGEYEVQLNFSEYDLVSGIYICRLVYQGHISSIKMVLLK